MLEMDWCGMRLTQSPYANQWRLSSGVFGLMIIGEITKILISKLLLITYFHANKADTEIC
jgi:hypothetical protein